MTAARPQVQALCCECGTVRMTTAWNGRGEDDLDALDRLNALVTEKFTPIRCTVFRKCATCRRQTRHAYLRGDEHRDEGEFQDRLHALPTQLAVWEIKTELAARGNVRLRHVTADDRGAGVGVTWYLYENTYTVTIYGEPPTWRLLDLLQRVQKRIAGTQSEDRECFDWFVRPESKIDKPQVNIMWADREQ